jgi:RND family efflux transporter MFP subunit
MNTRRTALRALALLWPGIGLASCGQPETRREEPAISVEIAAVRTASGAPALNVTGVAARQREAALSFRVAGVINRLTVDAGDRVTTGQTIAALNARDIESRLAAARAEMVRAEQDLSRVAGLADAGAISQQQNDDLETRAVSARAAFAAARFDSQSSHLAAPFPGIILARHAQQGEFAQPGQAIVTLADSTSPLVLKLPVADRDISQIAMGAAARVAAPNGDVTGRVTRIGQGAAQQSGTIEVEVTLPPGSGLTSGMTATAQLATKPARGKQARTRVPAEAILEANGTRAYVMRLDAARGIAVRTPIGFAGFDGDDALVSGLPPQSRVITGGAGYIADGQKVSVARQPAP